MARVFSLPTVLRQVPKPLLGRFFERMNVPIPGVDWGTIGERDIKPIQTELNGFSNAVMTPIENELRTIFDMACDAGINALIETAGAHGDFTLAERLPPELSHYGRSMWVWLEHRDYFIQAGLLYQVDQLSWWRKRNDAPRVEPRRGDDDLDLLKREISKLLLVEQGRGRLCSVELLQRGAMTYYFAYPDDFVQSVQEHDDDGRLAPRAVRRTFNIVFAYDSENGTLELFTKMPSKLKFQLEALFARHILSAELEAWRPPAAFSLNHLRLRSTRLAVDPTDAVSVSIFALRLSPPGSNRKIDITADPDNGPEDIHDMIAEYLNRERLRIEDTRVRGVTLIFDFAPLGDRKPGAVKIEINFPSTCNLRHHRPERVEIIQKYLQAWKIDVRPDELWPLPSRRYGAAAVA